MGFAHERKERGKEGVLSAGQIQNLGSTKGSVPAAEQGTPCPPSCTYCPHHSDPCPWSRCPAKEVSAPPVDAGHRDLRDHPQPLPAQQPIVPGFEYNRGKHPSEGKHLACGSSSTLQGSCTSCSPDALLASLLLGALVTCVLKTLSGGHFYAFSLS